MKLDDKLESLLDKKSAMKGAGAFICDAIHSLDGAVFDLDATDLHGLRVEIGGLRDELERIAHDILKSHEAVREEFMNTVRSLDGHDTSMEEEK